MIVVLLPETRSRADAGQIMPSIALLQKGDPSNRTGLSRWQVFSKKKKRNLAKVKHRLSKAL
jgi:hypothetical protein